jgi:hypothetical protein
VSGAQHGARYSPFAVRTLEGDLSGLLQTPQYRDFLFDAHDVHVVVGKWIVLLAGKIWVWQHQLLEFVRGDHDFAEFRFVQQSTTQNDTVWVTPRRPFT